MNKKDALKKISASVLAAVVPILAVIGNINNIVQFFQTLTDLFGKSSLPIKFLYVGLIIVVLTIIIVIVTFVVYKFKKRERAARPMKDFIMEVQRYNDDDSSDFVKPFVSKSFDYLMAKTSENSTQYNAEKMNSEGIDVRVYQAALAKKIARADDAESCQKAYRLLNHVINSWNVFLNDEKKIISYWIFVALNEERYNEISNGNIDEKDIELQDVNFLDVPGRYWGYLLLAGSADACKTQTNRWELYDSWLKYIEELARKGIFFIEIASMVGSEWGNSSLKSIGMTNYSKYKFGGNMYKYILSDIGNIDYLVKLYPDMADLYKIEFGGIDDAD